MSCYDVLISEVSCYDVLICEVSCYDVLICEVSCYDVLICEVSCYDVLIGGVSRLQCLNCTQPWYWESKRHVLLIGVLIRKEEAVDQKYTLYVV